MKPFEISIRVEDENDLYNHFDAQGMTLSDDLTAYIARCYTEKHFGEDVRITFSGAKIDAERLKAALHRYIDRELEQNAKERKSNLFKQLGCS